MRFYVLQSYRHFAGHESPKLRRVGGKIAAFTTRDKAVAFRGKSNGVTFIDEREGKLTTKYIIDPQRED